jgi:hypothetical protein
VPFKDLEDAEIRRVFQHANNYLADVFTMLGANPSPKSNAGKCNFSMALVLSCVLDGLATEIFPILPRGNVEERISRLLERVDWGKESDGWVLRSHASEMLYQDIRGPLVHHLAAENSPPLRRPGYSDPAIVREMIDGTVLTPDQVDAVQEWNPKWPIMWARTDDAEPHRLVLSTTALYWHVKHLTLDLATNAAIINDAVINRPRRKIRGSTKAHRPGRAPARPR